MTEPLETPRLALHPLSAADVTALSPHAVQWSRELSLDSRSLDDLATTLGTAACASSAWSIATRTAIVGLALLQPPSQASLQLRAIGWRSRELLLLIDPAHRRQGYASEAIEAIATHAGGDGVTFALVASVPAGNHAGQVCLLRCGFHELGRIETRDHTTVVFERAV